jgi:hypothetical protein
VPRHEPLDPGEEGLLVAVVDPELEEAGQRLGVDLLLDARDDHERLDLAREGEEGSVDVVERLDPEPVAADEELTGGRVVEREGKHPQEVPEHVLAPLGIPREDHLGVGLEAELVPLGHQLGLELAEVVDLAVEDDDEPPVGAPHRLVGLVRGVDDRQPPVPEADRAVEEDAVAVRAAVDQLVVHGLQEVTVVMTVETDDPAHRQLLVLRSGGRAGARRR